MAAVLAYRDSIFLRRRLAALDWLSVAASGTVLLFPLFPLCILFPFRLHALAWLIRANLLQW